MKKLLHILTFFMLLAGIAKASLPVTGIPDAKLFHKLKSATILQWKPAHTDILIRSLSLQYKTSGNNETASFKSIASYMNEVIYKEWESNTWVNDARVQYIFDANDLNTESFTHFWENSQWVNGSHSILTYDALDRLSNVLMQVWDEDYGIWVDMLMMNYTWNALNNPTEILMTFNFAGTWYNFRKISYIYDANQYCSEIITQEYNMSGGSWVNYSRNLFTYDGNGWCIEELTQDWVGNTWVDEEKAIKTNNALGYMTEQMKYLWLGGTWENYLHFTYTFDGQWNKIGELSEIWNGAWENHTQYTFMYDTQNRLIEELEQNWQAKGWVNKELGTWTYGLALGTPSMISLQEILTVFPNPADEMIQIMVEIEDQEAINAELYDFTGRIAMISDRSIQKQGSTLITIETRNLTPGCYFLMVSSEKYRFEPVKVLVIH